MAVGKIKSYFNTPTGSAAIPQAVICGSVINKGAASGTIKWGGGDDITIAAGDAFTLQFIPGHTYNQFSWDASGTTFYVALTIADF